jgi:hypothetical protein
MPEVKTIDINDPILLQEMVEANAEADFFELPPPPPDDRDYVVKVGLGDRGMTVKRQMRKGDADGQPSGPLFLICALENRIIDADQPWNDAPLFDNATSIIMGSSGTSLLHAILRALGHPALGRMNLSELRDHALSVFSSELTCGVGGKWEASVKKEDGTGKYKTIRKGMKNFPLIDPADPNSGHYPYADVIDPDTKKATGETVRAQFKINRYFLIQ